MSFNAPGMAFLLCQLAEQRLKRVRSSPRSLSGSSFQCGCKFSPFLFLFLPTGVSLSLSLPVLSGRSRLELAEGGVLVLGLVSTCDGLRGESCCPAVLGACKRLQLTILTAVEACFKSPLK